MEAQSLRETTGTGLGMPAEALRLVADVEAELARRATSPAVPAVTRSHGGPRRRRWQGRGAARVAALVPYLGPVLVALAGAIWLHNLRVLLQA
jgi:hypothetical protein